MARIRSIKPEFYRHEELFNLENNHKLPIRIAFAGLWSIADREGRFKWKPNQIKLDILPYDPIDIEKVLLILADAGFIEEYEVAGKKYAHIPSWNNHQIPNRNEPPSEIPAPDGQVTLYDRPATQSMRINIYKRDSYCCVYCGENLLDKIRAICLDHVIPYIKNGTNREFNLVTSCKKCNAKKGDRTPYEANMPWPSGLGEIYLNNKYQPFTETVNPLSTDGKQVLDKEGEREGEGKGILGEGKVIGTVPEKEKIEFTNPLQKIYDKTWPEYEKILNGQSKKMSEIIFIKWKEFVDFIWDNDYTDVFKTKFISPIDFGVLLTEKKFLPDKWKPVIESILATGVTPQQNLFFRIPQFMDYAKSGKQSKQTVAERQESGFDYALERGKRKFNEIGKQDTAT